MQTKDGSLSAEQQELLSQANVLLQNHYWDQAERLFSRVLERNPFCSDAWIGKLLAGQQADSLKALSAPVRLDRQEAFHQALNYANDRQRFYLVEA